MYSCTWLTVQCSSDECRFFHLYCEEIDLFINLSFYNISRLILEADFIHRVSMTIKSILTIICKLKKPTSTFS